MSDRPVYEVRRGACDPRGNPPAYHGRWETFSVGIATAGSRAAAIYRVVGSTRQPQDVDRLAGRLVAWLNDPRRMGRKPLGSRYRTARIRLTAAGKEAGWLKP